MWTSIKSSAWHGSLSRNSCPIQTPQYISFSLCASLHPSFSKGPVGEWFPPKIIYSYGLTGMKGNILFMSLSTCLMLKLLLLEKYKVILTSFLMTLRFSSRFTIRNLTVEIKKTIVKYSGCNMSLHKLASPFLCSSIHVSLFTSEMLRSFPNQPSPEPPTPEGFVWEAYTQLCAAEPHCLYLERLQIGVNSGLVYSGVCLQSIHIVKTVGTL